MVERAGGNSRITASMYFPLGGNGKTASPVSPLRNELILWGNDGEIIGGIHPRQPVDSLTLGCPSPVARLEIRPDAPVIKDLNAPHGIFVNGKRVEEAELFCGDVVGLGEDLGFSFLIFPAAEALDLPRTLLALEYGKWVIQSGRRLFRTFHVDEGGELGMVDLDLDGFLRMEQSACERLLEKYGYVYGTVSRNIILHDLFGGSTFVPMKDEKRNLRDHLRFVPTSVLLKLLERNLKVDSSSGDFPFYDPLSNGMGLGNNYGCCFPHEVGHFLAWCLLSEEEKSDPLLYSAYHGEIQSTDLPPEKIPKAFQQLAVLTGAKNGQWICDERSYRTSFYEYLAYTLESLFVGGKISVFAGAEARGLDQIFSFLLARRALVPKDLERYAELYRFRYREEPCLITGVDSQAYRQAHYTSRGVSAAEEEARLKIFLWQKYLGHRLTRFQEIAVRVGKDPLKREDLLQIRTIAQEKPDALREHLKLLGQQPSQE